MTEFQFSYGQSVMTYKVFGNGPELVLCFHGYGESAAVFTFLEKYAGNKFTFIALEMPHHGLTKWIDGQVFKAEDLKKIVLDVLNTSALSSIIHNPITLLGFSLGGRVALSLYQSIPEQIKKIVLLAPDGLKMNFWYWLATQTWIGNRLFAITMKHPSWFFVMLKLLNKLKLVNTSIFKFVKFYIGDAEAREMLFKRWTILRKIKPGISGIKSLIKENKTPVELLYGKHDRIILPAVGEKFRNGIEKFCRISIIESGHQVLHERHVMDIVNSLTRDN